MADIFWYLKIGIGRRFKKWKAMDLEIFRYLDLDLEGQIEVANIRYSEVRSGKYKIFIRSEVANIRYS